VQKALTQRLHELHQLFEISLRRRKVKGERRSGVEGVREKGERERD